MSTEKKNSFRLSTLNVHMWEDGSNIDNVDRVVELIKRHKPDVLCLQETYSDSENDFARQCPEYLYRFSLNCCSILSKFPAKEVFTRAERKRDMRFRRFVTARIEVPGASNPLFLTCLHFNYQLEPKRLIEADTLSAFMTPLFETKAAQIWTGDFNALTKEDYTREEWQHVTDVRERNHWEAPMTDLTNKVKKFGFIDCWTAAGCSRPLGTCRFDTRIDYIYATPSVFNEFKLTSVFHVPDKASDHNMVVADFEVKTVNGVSDAAAS